MHGRSFDSSSDASGIFFAPRYSRCRISFLSMWRILDVLERFRVQRFLYLFPTSLNWLWWLSPILFLFSPKGDRSQSSLNYIEFNIIFRSLIFYSLLFSVIFNKKYFILFRYRFTYTEIYTHILCYYGTLRIVKKD